MEIRRGDSNRAVDLRSDGSGSFFFLAPVTRERNREERERRRGTRRGAHLGRPELEQVVEFGGEEAGQQIPTRRNVGEVLCMPPWRLLRARVVDELDGFEHLEQRGKRGGVRARAEGHREQTMARNDGEKGG